MATLRRSRWRIGRREIGCRFLDLENHQGLPVYVHAKICVIDDVWAAVGSDNFHTRSWTHVRS